MEIIHDNNQLEKYINEAVKVSGKSPVLIDKFLEGAIELDVDAICDGKEVFVAGIMQHIEEAGIHSGDSACCIPPFSLNKKIIEKINHQTKILALNLGVIGLINIQFAIQKDEIFVLEVNPRASRTVPFVSKALNIPIAKIATKVMAGQKIKKLRLKNKKTNVFAIKEAVFPFNKFPEVDTILGPEMKSTGESMGIDKDFGIAFAKSQISAGNSLPKNGSAFISVKDDDKPLILNFAKKLKDLGFEIYGTGKTADKLNENGIICTKINKVREGSPHIVELLENKKIALVINTSSGLKSITDSQSIRRTALNNNIPYFTTVSGAILQNNRGFSKKKNERFTDTKYLKLFFYRPISFEGDIVYLNTSSVFFNFFFFHTMPTFFITTKKISIIIFIRNGFYFLHIFIIKICS